MRADLSPEAARDLKVVLKASHAFGAAHARTMAARLKMQLDRIAAGRRHGHIHPDLALRGRILRITVAPLLIFYDQDTLKVPRMVDGRRGVPPLLSDLP